MGATTLRVVVGRVCCYLCRDEVDNLTIAQEIKDEGSDKYVFLCPSCKEFTTGIVSITHAESPPAR